VYSAKGQKVGHRGRENTKEKPPRKGNITRKKKEISFMQHHCPICKTPTDSTIHTNFPFCSERCRLRDLGNWATEKYVVSEPIFSEDDEEPDKPLDSHDENR
jgi:uncharacterized protein